MTLKGLKNETNMYVKFQLRYILYKSDVFQKNAIIVILALTVSCCQLEQFKWKHKSQRNKVNKSFSQRTGSKKKTKSLTVSVYFGKMGLNWRISFYFDVHLFIRKQCLQYFSILVFNFCIVSCTCCCWLLHILSLF